MRLTGAVILFQKAKTQQVKKSSVLLIGILAYFGIKAFAKKSAAEKLQFFVSKVSVRLSGITPIVDIILSIQNPTSETLRVGSIYGQLYLNGNYVANINGTQLTDVKGFGVSSFPISARLSVTGVISEIVDIIQALINNPSLSALSNQTLGFKGYVGAEGLTVPLNFTYKVL